MSRERLDNRRGSLTFGFEHDRVHYVASCSRYPDGRLAEIFLNGAKINTNADILARDCAIAASLSLQNGCSVDDLRSALTRTEMGGPAGPLAVALDLIAQDSTENAA